MVVLLPAMTIRALALAALLAGCAAQTTLTYPGEAGFDAVRFVRPVQWDGAMGNRWEIRSGTVLIGDRTRVSDGARLFCGSMVINGTAQTPVCAAIADPVISLSFGGYGAFFDRELPAGAIERFNLR